jgi:tRNA A-37 threonylcarbamoyl transferase component Bud32
LYFVNWQRDISVEDRGGRKVIIKRNKSTKDFHEFIIMYTYSLISLLLVHPSSPVSPREIMLNEGHLMRNNLAKLGIQTPELIAISDEYLIEEYIDGGDLYQAFLASGPSELASDAGALTGKMHRAGYAFVDNKAQNFLVKEDHVVRTDLGFTKTACSDFAKSMDVGSFLASAMDLRSYPGIEQRFYKGYLAETGHGFSHMSIVIRNLLSLGFSSNSTITFQNMILDTRPVVHC